MTIEIANRLLEYRKRSGLSQEELADKLGISRQSVSKWERAEAAPDTENLIELAKIYGVSLDDLLNVSVSIKDTNEKTIKEEDFPNIVVKEDTELDDESDNDIYLLKGGIKVVDDETDEETFYSYNDVYTKSSDGTKIPLPESVGFNRRKTLTYRQKNVMKVVESAFALAATILYLSLCLTGIQSWSKFWVVFIGSMFLCSVFDTIYTKRLKHLNFALLVSTVYLSLGVYLNLWTPYWFLFILIPVYYSLIGLFIDRKRYIYYTDRLKVEHSIEVNEGQIEVFEK